MKKLLALLLLAPCLAWGQTVFSSGLVAKGQIGAFGVLRQDAQFEAQNFILGRHALISIYNADSADEAGLTYGTNFSDGHAYSMVGAFARLVNGYNGWGFKSVYGVHVTGGTQDSQNLLAWSNNSTRLCGGSVYTSPWNRVPADNVVEIGEGGVVQGGCPVVFYEVPAHPAPLPNGSKLYQLNGALWVMPPNGTPKQIAP